MHADYYSGKLTWGADSPHLVLYFWRGRGSCFFK